MEKKLQKLIQTINDKMAALDARSYWDKNQAEFLDSLKADTLKKLNAIRSAKLGA